VRPICTMLDCMAAGSASPTRSSAPWLSPPPSLLPTTLELLALATPAAVCERMSCVRSPSTRAALAAGSTGRGSASHCSRRSCASNAAPAVQSASPRARCQCSMRDGAIAIESSGDTATTSGWEMRAATPLRGRTSMAK
jgi:hypothetical protein